MERQNRNIPVGRILRVRTIVFGDVMASIMSNRRECFGGISCLFLQDEVWPNVSDIDNPMFGYLRYLADCAASIFGSP